MGKLLPILVAATGLSENDIRRIVRNAPIRYKSYTIPKRRGGERNISQPARELKALQRVLVQEVLSGLPIHPSATAYRLGRSIRDNAAAHVRNGPIFKFDFKDFFPSITSRDWQRYCSQHELFDDPEDIYVSTQVFFRRAPGATILRLAIGAPSSPRLSNVLMNEFDTTIARLVSADTVIYTRYADDLTFSARRTGYLTGVEKNLRRAIKEVQFPALKLNESKTVLATMKYKRMITGLILANDGQVSLGHEKKRQIRAAVHHYREGKLDIQEQASLAGMLAFVNDVEPEFLVRLTSKYGSAVISRIKQAVVRRNLL